MSRYLSFEQGFDLHGTPERIVGDLYSRQVAKRRVAIYILIGEECVVGNDDEGGRDRLAAHGHIFLRV